MFNLDEAIYRRDERNAPPPERKTNNKHFLVRNSDLFCCQKNQNMERLSF